MPAFFYCAGCHYTRKATEEYAGMLLNCPQCGRKGVIESFSRVDLKPVGESQPKPTEVLDRVTDTAIRKAGSPPPSVPATPAPPPRKSDPEPVELETMEPLKSCPYCAEMINHVARKCKHCGEFLTDELRERPAPPPKRPEPRRRMAPPLSVLRARPRPIIRETPPPAPPETEDDEELEAPSSDQSMSSPSREPNATPAFLCGLVGVFIFWPILGLMAMVTGIVSMKNLIRDPHLQGKGMATAAIILGIVDILIGTIVIMLLLGRK